MIAIFCVKFGMFGPIFAYNIMAFKEAFLELPHPPTMSPLCTSSIKQMLPVCLQPPFSDWKDFLIPCYTPESYAVFNT